MTLLPKVDRIVIAILAHAVLFTAPAIGSTHFASINGKSVKVYNTTACSDGSIDQMVSKADTDSGGLMDAGDRVFVRARYMIWLDDTGFYGAMNGVWRMQQAGTPATCSFLNILGNGRVPNALLPGEDGNGFVGGIPKGMHWEVLSPPAGNLVYFSSNDWIKIPSGSTWCNATQSRYQNNSPVLDDANPSAYHTFQWVVPLTMEARPSGSPAVCHARDFLDWRDDNGVRGALNLRVTYNLGVGTDPKIAMGVALNNPGPEPVTLSNYGVIGGFVAAKLSTSVPWKAYAQYYFVGPLSPDTLNHTLLSNTWAFHPQGASTDHCIVQPVYGNYFGVRSDPSSNPTGKMTIYHYSTGSTDQAGLGWTRDTFYKVFLAEGSAFDGDAAGNGRVIGPGETTATAWRTIQFE